VAKTIEIARQLAALGFPVFPCGRKKLPAIGKKDGGSGFLDATCDPEEIKSLFWKAPRAPLVGVPTGQISGFDVLDIDYRHGGGVWEEANKHLLPETRVHQSMSGGRHYLFQHAPGVRNSASKIASGVDIRGDGGYVIFPPSTGYTIVADAPPCDWPDWLLLLVLARPMDKERPSEGTVSADKISDARLEGLKKSILGRVSSAADGQKHYQLRNAALSLGGIIDKAGISVSSAVQMLVDALPGNVADWDNAKKTALWGVERGQAKPLELPDRPEYQPRFVSRPAPTQAVAALGEMVSAAISPPGVEDHGRPVIRVLSGLRHWAADQGLQAMASARVPFYQRGRSLVRAALSKAKTSDGQVVEIPGIVDVTLPILCRALGSVAEWERVKADGEPVRIDPPKEVVEQIGSMFGEWPFPPLTGVIGTPTMRPDGSILDAVGYDDATGLVLISPPKMPSIPDRPTRVQANQARETLLDLLSEFPFADETSRSVALSMILTAVLRGALLPAVPMHVATAPQPGTGKSYLLDIASAIATGERCAVIAIAPNPEETEKRLIGAALSGQPIIAIDNVSDTLAGDFLMQVTERPLLQVRPLGTSKPISISNTFTVFANGNNLCAAADLVRRTIICRLDANLENPEEREFKSNPVKVVLADRGKYVAACLVIGRAYIVAERPGMLRSLPSFEPWSDLVRSAIVWIGMNDPCDSMELARAEDPIRAARSAVFTSWATELGLNPNGLTTAELISEAEAIDDHGFLHKGFREACLSVAAERSGTTISGRRLGKYLASAEKNRVGDLKLTINRQDVARPRWVLSKA
jgi:putative DNA primase/helicase